MIDMIKIHRIVCPKCYSEIPMADDAVEEDFIQVMWKHLQMEHTMYEIAKWMVREY